MVVLVLECIASTESGSVLVGMRIPIEATGVVFVGELRASQQPEGARIIALNDATVTSGRNGHCRVWLNDERVVLCDCESDNGTWILNGDGARRVGSIHSPT